MARLFHASALLVLAAAAPACPECRPKVRAVVYDAGFPGRVAALLLPVAALAAVGVALGRWDRR